MKPLIALLLVLATLAAADNGQNSFSSVNPIHPDPGSDVITITPLGTYPITFTTDILGIAYTNNTVWDHLIGVGEDDNMLYEFDSQTGNNPTSAPLASGNTEAFGICYNPASSGLIYTNDWNDTVLYEFFSSTTLPNPAATDGRGMDFDGTWYWQVVSDGALHRLLAWQPSGDTYWYDVSAHIPSQMSGCVSFWDPSLYIAVTCYNSDYLYVFQISGSSFTYIGNALLTVTPDAAYDLAYSEDLDRFFLSYSSGSTYSIAMFSMDLGLALEQATWAEIKSSF